MPWTIAGYSESQDSANLVNVAALADSHLRVQGDDLIVPDWAPLLLQALAVGPNLTRAQLVSPTLRRVMNVELSPLVIAAIPASPHRIASFLPDGIELVPDEAVNAQAAEDNAAAARATILLWIGDEVPAPIAATIYTVRFTLAFSAAPNAWTNGSINFDQTLQPGEYACVGATLRSTNLQAFRFVVPGAFHRPGGVGSQSAGDLLLPGQRKGGWGEWFRFRHNTPPTVDVLANAADASFVGEMDLVYLS